MKRHILKAVLTAAAITVLLLAAIWLAWRSFLSTAILLLDVVIAVLRAAAKLTRRVES